MAKAASTPVPDPLPAEGGSYLLDAATGKWTLLDRTEPAKLPGTEPPAALLDTAPPAELLDAEPSAELLDAEPPA